MEVAEVVPDFADAFAFDEFNRMQREALPALLDALGRRNLRSIMVEGGARIITSFLTHHLVDHVAITMTNRFVGGLRAVGSLQRPAGNGTCRHVPADAFPRLQNLRYQCLGEDLILEGDPLWGD